MPTGTMGLRTIWITLRAVNYTAQVFRDVIRDTTLLSDSEKLLTKQTMMAGQHALSAGLMWTVLGQSIDNSITKNITQIGVISQLTNVMKPYVAGFLTLMGVMQMVIGIEKMYIAIKTSKLITIYAEAIAVNILASSWKTLALSMGAAVGIFLILRGPLGTIPALLIAMAVAVGILAVQMWIAAGAMSSLTWGTSAIAGMAAIGLAIAGTIAAVAGIREFPLGTRMVEQTGMAIVHKQEVIYNPTTNRPTQIGNDLNNGNPSTTVFEMPVTIEEMNTKADVDDVDEVLRRGLHKIAKSVRG